MQVRTGVWYPPDVAEIAAKGPLPGPLRVSGHGGRPAPHPVRLPRPAESRIQTRTNPTPAVASDRPGGARRLGMGKTNRAELLTGTGRKVDADHETRERRARGAVVRRKLLPWGVVWASGRQADWVVIEPSDAWVGERYASEREAIESVARRRRAALDVARQAYEQACALLDAPVVVKRKEEG